MTLNVVWMERESDAYKLSRCMCPSKYNNTAILWKKSAFHHTFLHSTPQLGGFPSDYRHPLWYGKTRMVSLPDGEKFLKISLFVLAQLTNVTDGQTVGRTPVPSFSPNLATTRESWVKRRLWTKIYEYFHSGVICPQNPKLGGDQTGISLRAGYKWRDALQRDIVYSAL